jgi:hypothetical protein
MAYHEASLVGVVADGAVGALLARLATLFPLQADVYEHELLCTPRRRAGAPAPPSASLAASTAATAATDTALRLRCVLAADQDAAMPPLERRTWQLCHLGAGDTDRKRAAAVRTIAAAELYTGGLDLVLALGYAYVSVLAVRLRFWGAAQC